MPRRPRTTSSSLLLFMPFALAVFSCEDEVVTERPVHEVLYGEATTSRLLPFPSDRYTVPDATSPTGKRVTIGPSTTADPLFTTLAGTAERLSELDGFSTVGGIAIGFSGPIDASAFAHPDDQPLFGSIDPAAFTTGDSPIVLVDTDPDSPEYGEAIGLLPRYFAQAKDDYYLEDEYTVVARPVRPLRSRTRYTFVVTSRLRDDAGRPLGRSSETTALLESESSAYADQVRAGLDVIEAELGITKGDVLVASSFTTLSTTESMVAAGVHLRELPPPAIVEPWSVVEEDAGSGRVRLRARFRTSEYRGPDGVFVFEDGLPVPQDVHDMEAFLVLHTNAEGRQPVAIFQHGLGGDKGGCWGTAQRLSALDAAVVAIDSPEHGDRGTGTGDNLDSVLGFFAVDKETLSFDIGRARDNFRQMTLDQLSLVLFMQTQAELDLLPLGAPDGEPDLDVSRMLYIGHSFGGVQGAGIFAIAPEIRHAVWNVGGDGLMFLLEDSPLFSIFVDSLRPPNVADGQLARFLAATQAIVDPGDGLNYARLALDEPLYPEFSGPRSVLLQETIDDTIVPNTSTEALARAAGLALLSPVRAYPGATIAEGSTSTPRPDGSTGVITQFAFMNGTETATHGELIFSEEARAQYVEFFTTGLETGTSVVHHDP